VQSPGTRWGAPKDLGASLSAGGPAVQCLLHADSSRLVQTIARAMIQPSALDVEAKDGDPAVASQADPALRPGASAVATGAGRKAARLAVVGCPVLSECSAAMPAGIFVTRFLYCAIRCTWADGNVGRRGSPEATSSRSSAEVKCLGTLLGLTEPAESHALETRSVVIANGQVGGPLVGRSLAYRELLDFLTGRDVKVRYKQTAIGAAWDRSGAAEGPLRTQPHDRRRGEVPLGVTRRARAP
jgi:hypothetical protein